MDWTFTPERNDTFELRSGHYNKIHTLTEVCTLWGTSSAAFPVFPLLGYADGCLQTLPYLHMTRGTQLLPQKTRSIVSPIEPLSANSPTIVGT